MQGKYEKLRVEIESIYYADYIIDRLYEKIYQRSMDFTDYRWLDSVMEAVRKLCKFQIYYMNNCKLLYGSKYKNAVIKCLINNKKVNSSDRYGLEKFYKEWEANKVGI
jgi:hypothetical protein